MGASAHAGRGVGVLLVLACLLWLAAPAARAQMPVTSDPLPGSSFQGGDGDQADAGEAVDWQMLAAQGRVQHSADADEPDSIFARGSQETEPGGWDLRTGSAEAKSDIVDAWTAVDQPGANTFVYLAFARESANGETFLTFELSHDARLWDNGRAEIPCRRTGDVQVSYEAGNQGVDVVIRRWTTTEADEISGCATVGRLDDFTALTANVDVQGAVNGADIPSFLPGVYDSVPSRRFGEASVNLVALLQEAFGDRCLAFNSVWMHSRASTSITSNMEDYVAPRRLAVRTCSASGTKFFDADDNHERDAGERGVPRFLIWADYDGDGVQDPVEPFSVTDNQGQYVIYDIRPPQGTYALRERLVRRPRPSHPIAAAGWVCSFPTDSTPGGGTGSAPGGRFGCGWGSIDVAATPNASGRDFGNWFPARLTIEKELEPVSDGGRFDLLRDDQLVLAAAGDGDRVTMRLPPGTYAVSERPASGTDAANYNSTVECRRDASDRGQTRQGVSYEGLELAAGDQATCTFRNIRKPPPPTPAIAIRKTGPETATAGDTLHYTLYVANPGHVPFAEAAVDVTDPRCDRDPRLVSKPGDDMPGTLDPGDEWRYRCSRQTSSDGERCVPRSVDNTATVIGSAGGTTVTDEDAITTILLCPDDPEPPDPEPPDPAPIDPPGPQPPLPPDDPGPVAPAGPPPPNAGDSGLAGIIARQATRRCVATPVARVNIRGTRIAAVRIFVNGHLERRVIMRILQRRARARLPLTPGRYRITARVRFQNGSGTPAVTLRRVIRICNPPSARCTSANPGRRPHSQPLLSRRPASARPRAQAAC